MRLLASALVRSRELGLLRSKVRVGSGIRAQRQPNSGLDTHDKPTFAAVALLHLKRMAAIRAVEGHPIERVNGRFGPEAAIMLIAVKVRFVPLSRR
jgi:hypothetical protein